MLPYFQFYPGDWLQDQRITMGMGIAEEGAYHRLLCLMWVDKSGTCSIRDDDDAIARGLRVSVDEWHRIRAVLVDGPDAVVAARDGRLWNKRLLEEWEKAQSKSAKASVAAGTRWGDGQENAPAMRSHEPSICPSDANGYATGHAWAMPPLRSPDREREKEVPTGTSLSADADPDDPLPPSVVVALWNDVCGSVLPRATKATDERIKHIRARLSAERGRDRAWWRCYFGRIAASPWCRGDNPRSWRASFDWAIRSEQTVAKVLEGTYDPRPGAVHRPDGAVHRAAEPAGFAGIRSFLDRAEEAMPGEPR